MKNQYAERTDRKLRYAKIHLDELIHYHNSGSGDDFERAHCESFLFQLIGARDTFLQEINISHKLGLSVHNVTMRTFKRLIVEKEKIISAFSELLNTIDQPNSWLNLVIKLRNAVTHSLEFNRIFDDDRTIIILIIDGEKQTTGRDFREDFKEWYDNMVELLIKLRSLLPE